MALGKHKRTEKGTFRKERADSLIKNLKEEYPVLAKINGNMKLGTLEKKLKVDSLRKVIKTLREKKNK